MAGDVLVVAEHREGALVGLTLELVTAARRMTASSGGSVKALLLGGSDAIAGSIAATGVEVLHASDPAWEHYTVGGYTQGVAAALSDHAARAVLFPHSSQGFDVAPCLAATVHAPIVTNVVDVAIDGEALVATRRILNEKVQVDFAVTSTAPWIVTVRPAAFKGAGAADGGRVTPISLPVDASKIRTRFLRYEKPTVQDIDISGADVVVSAGRGIQKKENLGLVEEFARLLGGVVGASRPLTDLEWLPKTRQVGQSGKTVRPKLYIACGISGAMQHIAGMKDSGLIVAINTDPSAPIFEVAHVGLTANVLELIPIVVKALKGG